MKSDELTTVFPIGCRVKTSKGDRFKGPFEGTVTGYTKWKDYDAVLVKKSSGRNVTCLARNLSKIEELPQGEK